MPRSKKMNTPTRHLLPAVLLTALLGGIFPGPALAGKTPAEAARATLTINVRILPVMKVANLVYPSQLAVSAADIERGYVDVDGESSIQVQSNHSAGLSLSAQAQDALVTAVHVRAAVGRAATQAASASAYVPVTSLQRQTVNVAYRLFLAASAQPGQYRWPAALSFAQ